MSSSVSHINPGADPAATGIRIGFSGHRPNRLSLRARLTLPLRLRDHFKQLGRDRNPALWTGLAPGADQMACRAALALGWPLHVLLPYPIERCGPDDLADPALLAQAASIEILHAPPAQAYSAIADRLLDRIDLLVAAHDGRGAAGPGGTSDVVARARDRAITVVEIRI